MRRLLIRPGAIGDCILSFPALEFLRTDYTELWVPSPVIPLIDFVEAVYPLSSTGLDLFGLDDLSIAPLLLDRLQSFDQIVSWYGTNRKEFRWALSSLGVPCQFHQALPSTSDDMHAIDFFCAQVGAPFGSIPRVRLRATPVPRGSIIIHPFSGSSKKNWPLASFCESAARLKTSVEWIAGPDEQLPEAHRFDNLRDLVEWMAGAQLYLGNDSGITHLAAAVGVPVVALFGSTSPKVWGPRGDDVIVLQQEGLNAGTVVQLIERLTGQS